MSKKTSSQLLKIIEGLYPTAIKLDLERLKILLARMDHPEAKLAPLIHVAGTNGKGSTSSMIRAMLEEHGRNIDAYHSPHLVRFHERILINGRPISEQHLVAALEHMLARNDGAPITFFEATTATAFHAFEQFGTADHVLLEVGLGGRLDATNIVPGPGISVITRISRDHMEYLGEDILGIADEKYGIARPERPLIIGPQRPDVAEHLYQKAKSDGLTFFAHGRDFEQADHMYHDAHGALDLSVAPLAGTHQWENAATACAAIRLGLGIHDLNLCNPAILQAGLANTHWPARLQDITKSCNEKLGTTFPHVLLDCGHNEDAGRVMANHMNSLGGNCAMILGLQPHKDAPGYLAHVAPYLDQLIQVPADVGLPVNDMAHHVPNRKLAHWEEAVRLVQKEKPQTPLVLCGSLYLSGLILKRIG